MKEEGIALFRAKAGHELKSFPEWMRDYMGSINVGFGGNKFVQNGGIYTGTCAAHVVFLLFLF